MTSKKIWVATICAAAMAMLSASGAQAKWGPQSHCGIRSTALEHCYALSGRVASDLGSIVFADDETANVKDWNEGGFITQEQWVGFSAQPGWIEMGQTEGNSRDCCTDYPFFAEKTPTGQYHERIVELPRVPMSTPII